MPISELNSRLSPVEPPNEPPAWPPPMPPPPPEPPLMRPTPLYPHTRSMKVLSVEPPMYGRADAGTRIVASTNQPAETINATVAPIRWPMRLIQPVFANIR